MNPVIFAFALGLSPTTGTVCEVNLDAVASAVVELENHYATVPSDIDCNAPGSQAQTLICQSDTLITMSRLDDMAWVYAYENATGSELDHDAPPRDPAFDAARDACTDGDCVCQVLIEHTNDSLGADVTPYVLP